MSFDTLLEVPAAPPVPRRADTLTITPRCRPARRPAAAAVGPSLPALLNRRPAHRLVPRPVFAVLRYAVPTRANVVLGAGRYRVASDGNDARGGTAARSSGTAARLCGAASRSRGTGAR
ncbi:hypothetical protein AB0E10_31825 [Streptomyces sp. NPDC048045]|uniref:hypothetical protein n=1 Tax=Streptomyces sp. NPDC048045 TaxID=3154710 RepID=UPI00341F12AB